MKTPHFIQSFLLLSLAFALSAQQGINYKAIICDSNGDPLSNVDITLQFTILENGTTNVYQETHSPTTDANGMIVVDIGEGTPQSGDFITIDWGNNPHFLRTRMNIGEGFTDLGTVEFKAVPYAFHAETVTEVDDADADPTNEIQDLSGLALKVNVLELDNVSAFTPDNDYEPATKIYVDELLMQIGGINELLYVGFTLEQLLGIGRTVLEIFQSGISVADLLNAGASVVDLVAAGASVSDLLAEGITVQELVNAGASISEMLENDVSISDLLEAGVDVTTLFDLHVGVGALEQNGATEQALTDAGLIGSLDDIDGNTYKWVMIGNQQWMAENLRTTKFKNGDEIPTTDPVTLDISNEDAFTATYQWAYDGDENNVSTYGRLYTYYGASCPEGWNIPTREQWIELENYLRNNGYSWNSQDHNYGKALASTNGWQISTVEGAMGNTDYPEYRNKSGFSAMPGGIRSSEGVFGGIGETSFYMSKTNTNWSSYPPDIQVGFFVGLYNWTYMIYDDGSLAKIGKSVRCIKIE